MKNNFAKTNKPQIREFLHGNSDNNKCCLIGLEDEKEDFKMQKSKNERFNENDFRFELMETPKLFGYIDNDSDEVSFS